LNYGVENAKNTTASYSNFKLSGLEGGFATQCIKQQQFLVYLRLKYDAAVSN
jgi:hypothetical protein